MKSKQSRISFDECDIAHLYDLALEHFCVSNKEGVCNMCLRLKTRMEKFIGKKEVSRLNRQVSKNGYCKNNKSTFVNKKHLTEKEFKKILTKGPEKIKAKDYFDKL